jgi:trans-aconitate 2-methyltransferase
MNMTTNHYTFGDSDRAAERLLLLARAYEQPSRELLERYRPPELPVALDLGAGPGHTTRLVHEVTGAQRTIGLEASERYLALARASSPPGVEFLREDVTAPSAAVPRAGLVFSRFLLTHLPDPGAALRVFRSLVAPGGLLLLQETADLRASHPALSRYYELVHTLQAHYGQLLYIGQDLPRFVADAPFTVVHTAVRRFYQPAAVMASIHLPNLRSWRTDPFAVRTFDRAELDELERSLEALASGEEQSARVELALGELVLR